MSIPLACMIGPEDVAETIRVKRSGRIHILQSYCNITLSHFCHLSKNLWNQAHHFVLCSKEYIELKMIPTYSYIDGILNKKSYYSDPDFDNYHKLGLDGQESIQRMGVWIYRR